MWIVFRYEREWKYLSLSPCVLRSLLDLGCIVGIRSKSVGSENWKFWQTWSRIPCLPCSDARISKLSRRVHPGVDCCRYQSDGARQVKIPSESGRSDQEVMGFTRCGSLGWNQSKPEDVIGYRSPEVELWGRSGRAGCVAWLGCAAVQDWVVAQRRCGCPLPGSVQGQVGRGFDHPCMVEGVPAHGRGVGTG